MTPLFSHNEITRISQGQSEDCYLLAILDCFMNTSPEGLTQIKSLFTETQAHVVVRLKQSALSHNLLKKPHPHFDHQVDEVSHEDVFTISKARCLEIDASPDGVQSDSLAVKILERICSYYFYNDWHGFTDSLSAHSIRDMAAQNDKFPMESIDFISQWLSFEVQKIPSVEHLGVLKTILTTLPVYLSVNGQKSRHAFRVEAITDTSCILVNPWNNMIREQVDSSLISANNPAMYLLNTDTHQYRLACFLLEKFADFSSEFADHIQTIQQAMEVPKSSDAYVAKDNEHRIQVTLAFLDLLLKRPVIATLPREQLRLLYGIVNALKSKASQLFPKVSLYNYYTLVPANKKIAVASVDHLPTITSSEIIVNAIRSMSISFSTSYSLDEIEQHKQLLIHQLQGFMPKKPAFCSQQSVFTLTKPNAAVTAVYRESLSLIETRSEQAKLDLTALATCNVSRKLT